MSDVKGLRKLDNTSQDNDAKRQRRDDCDTEEHLEGLISQISYKASSSLVTNIKNLAHVVSPFMTGNSETLIKIIIDCIINMPFKICIYTSFLGVLNLEDSHFLNMFIDEFVRELKNSLRNNEFSKAVIIVQTMADLANCNVITENSVLSLFDNFLEVVFEEGCSQSRSDWYYHCVISSLPIIGYILDERKPSDFQRLLNTIDKYMNKRNTDHVVYLSVWVNSSSGHKDTLQVNWSQIQDLERDHWSEANTYRPYVEMEGELSQGSLHILPEIVPPSHRDSNRYPLPSVVFRLFDYNDVPHGLTIPGSLSIDRYSIDSEISNIINTYFQHPQICADVLLSIPIPKHVAINYIIAEMLFGRMLSWVNKLPEMFFGSIWIFLIKKNPTEMSQILAQAVSIIYNNIEYMNIFAINIMARWFSHALSNFHYRWNWIDWADCAEVSKDHSKAVFVTETLKMSLRLSYYEKIRTTVPNVMSSLLPSPPDCTHLYSHDLTTASTRVELYIKKKSGVGEMLDMLDDLFPDSNNLMENGDAKIKVFFSTLLYLGCSAMSFTFAALTKYVSLLRKIVTTPRQKNVLLNTLRMCWWKNEQMMVVVIDKMIRMEIVDHISVINWIFGDGMVDNLSCFYVWEIIHRTITQISNKLDYNLKNLENLRDRYDSNVKKASNSALIGYNDDFDKIPDLSTSRIKQLEDELESLKDLQKNVIHILFQKIVTVLTDYIIRCSEEDLQVETFWFRAMIERLQEIFFAVFNDCQHQEHTIKYLHNLKSHVFTNEVDERILNVFYSFTSLRH